MILTAAKGLKVPMEFKPRDYITDDAVFKVEDSAYYARRISDGDLLPAKPEDWDAQEKAKSAAEEAAIKTAELAAKKAAKTTAE